MSFLRKQQYLFFYVILFLCLSFRVGYVKYKTNIRWNITANDPVVWLRFCEDGLSYIIDDPLMSSNAPSDIASYLPFIKQAILDQFNTINTSFLRLAMHPDDSHAVLVTTPYDSSFDEESAAVRTIEICTNQASKTLAGFAVPTVNNQIPECEDPSPGSYFETYCRTPWLYSCNITLIKESLTTIASFMDTLSHEIMHCLGVLHNHETHQSIMSYVSEGDEVAELTSDDKMALTYLYPVKAEYAKEVPTLGLACTPANGGR